jgi:MFS family permease
VYKTILGNRSLQVLGIAESVSGIGNWITMLAVFAMIVFDGGGSEAQSSAVFLAGLLPTLIFSPVAGWLCDRLDRKWLMIGSELASGMVVAGIIFARRLELIYGLLVLQAITTSIMSPARQASVPQLVGREDLSKANAFLQQLAGTIKIGAPVLAGALLAVMDPHTAIILDVVSFALSALILTRLPSLPPAGAPQPAAARHEAPAAPAGTLLSTLKSSWSLRFLFLLAFLAVLVFIGYDVLSSIFVRDVLHGEAGFYGMAIGFIGLGTVAGTVFLMAQKGEGRPWRDVVAGLALLGTIPASLALVAWLDRPSVGRVIVLATCLLGGVGNGFLNVQASTLLQLLSPPEILGRIGGAFQSTLVTGQLAGLLIVPALVPTLVSMGAYFALSAAIVVALVVYATIALSRRKVHSAPVASAAGMAPQAAPEPACD